MDGTGTADGDGSSSPQSMPSLMEPSIRPSLHSLHQDLSLQVKGVAALAGTDQQIQEQRLSGGCLPGVDVNMGMIGLRQEKTIKKGLTC